MKALLIIFVTMFSVSSFASLFCDKPLDKSAYAYMKYSPLFETDLIMTIATPFAIGALGTKVTEENRNEYNNLQLGAVTVWGLTFLMPHLSWITCPTKPEVNWNDLKKEEMKPGHHIGNLVMVKHFVNSLALAALSSRSTVENRNTVAWTYLFLPAVYVGVNRWILRRDKFQPPAPAVSFDPVTKQPMIAWSFTY